MVKQVRVGSTRSRSAKHAPLPARRRGAKEQEKVSPGSVRKTGAAPNVAAHRPTPRGAAKKSGVRKAPTGILGFDEITGGGLPRGRATLLVGGPGSGKTIFAMQFLVTGAREAGEPGILVAFEESPDRLVTNFDGFGWDLAGLRKSALSFVDAHPSPGLVQTGDFDLEGMLAVLGAKIRQTGARRIVFDAMDIMLALLPDDAARRREIYRLHDWLLQHEVTALITARALGDESSATGKDSFGFMQFMLADIYTAGGEVLMGTLRWEKESAEQMANEVAVVAGELKRVSLDAEEAVLEVRAKSLQTELVAKKVEKTLLSRTTESRERALTRGRIRMGELRGADATQERK